MISIKDLYSILAHQETPEEMGKERLQRLLDDCWKYSLEIEKNPKNAEAYLRRGDARYRLELLEDAVKDLEKAIALNTDSKRFAHMSIGICKKRLGAQEEEIMHFSKAWEDAESDKIHNRYCLLGEIEFYRGMHKEAIEHFDRAEELGKDDFSKTEKREIYYARGLACSVSGKHERAVEDLSKALALMSQDMDQTNAVYLARGQSMAKLKRYEEAIADFTQFISHEPQDMSAYCQRAEAYAALGKTELAEQDNKKFEELLFKNEPK